jgi:hypothetical protein
MASGVIMTQICHSKPIDVNLGKKVDEGKGEITVTGGAFISIRTLTSSSSGNPNHFLEDQLSTREKTYLTNFSYSNLLVTK